MTIQTADFGDGASVFHLEGGDVKASVTNQGAALVSLHHPDGANVVLGFADATGYRSDTQFVGVIVGRYANRIARGRFDLDGQTWELPCNDSLNHLHGGPDGFGNRLWDAEVDEAQNTVTFTLTSPHLDQGYPSRVTASAAYRLHPDGMLQLTLGAVSDSPTLVNLAPHAYFNLAGRGTVLDHDVKIYANRFTPTDDDLIPTGEIADVTDTPYDYRNWRTVDGDIDMNFITAKTMGTLRPVAEVRDPSSARHMIVEATAPGLQFYAGKHLAAGGTFPAHAGLCLEPQYFPDSPNHENFPTPRIEPGAPYREVVTYRFA